MPDRVASATLQINGNAPTAIQQIAQGAQDAVKVIPTLGEQVDKLSKSVAGLATGLGRAAAALGTFGEKAEGAERDLLNLNLGLGSAARAVEDIRTQSQGVGRNLSSIGRGAKSAADQVGRLADARRQLGTGLEELERDGHRAARGLNNTARAARAAARDNRRAARSTSIFKNSIKEFGGDLATLGGQLGGIDFLPGFRELGTAVTVVGDAVESSFNPLGAAIIATIGPLAIMTAEVLAVGAGMAFLATESREWVKTLEDAGRLDVIPEDALANLRDMHTGLDELSLSLTEAGTLLAAELSPLILQIEIAAIKGLRAMRDGFSRLGEAIVAATIPLESFVRISAFAGGTAPGLLPALGPMKAQVAVMREFGEAIRDGQQNARGLREELAKLTTDTFVGPTISGLELTKRQKQGAFVGPTIDQSTLLSRRLGTDAESQRRRAEADRRAAAQLERDIRQGVLRAIPPSIAEGFRDMVEALSILEGQVQLAADIAGLEQSVADAERAIAQGVQEAQGFAAQSAVEGGIGSLRGGLPGILRSVNFMPTNIAAAIIEVLPDVENLLNAVLSQVITTIELVPDVIRAIIGDFLPTLITSLDDIFFAFIDAIGTLPARIIEDLITDFIPALGDLVVQFAEEIRDLFTGEGGGQGRRRTAVTLASVAGFLAGGPAGAAAAGSIAFGVGQATRGRRGDGGSFAANTIANPSGAVTGQRGTPRVTVNLSRTGSPTLDTWGQDVARASALATAQGLARPTPLAI